MSDENKISVLEGEGNKPETPNVAADNSAGNQPKAQKPKGKQPKANNQKPKVNKPEVKKPEAKKPEVKRPEVKKPELKPTTRALSAVEADDSIAKSLMRKKGVKQIFKVGRYWFTDSQNAEQSERSQKLKMQIFD